MMAPAHIELARRVSSDVGMEFHGRAGKRANGDRWVLLTPTAVSYGHAFDVRVQLTWRRLRLSFEPQKFAGELVEAMGAASDVGRTGFRVILEQSVSLGAKVQFSVNGQPAELDDQAIWGERWTRLDLRMSKRLAQLDGGATAEELDLVCRWTRRFVAALLAVAPLERQAASMGEASDGFEEGAITVARTTRYERDRRNRAAAIAIHGTACLACGLEFGTRYGQVAEGFIEVHHTTSLAIMDGEYIVNPAQDLVPLCSNCHAVAHRRDPPLTVDEIRGLLG